MRRPTRARDLRKAGLHWLVALTAVGSLAGAGQGLAAEPGGAEPAAGAEKAATEPAAPAPAELTFANRHIVTLRARQGGADPAERVVRARERLANLPPEEYGAPVTARDIVLGRERGSAITVGDRFVVAVGDGDVEVDETRREVAAQAARRLAEALRAWHDQRSLPLLLKSIGLAAAATALLALAIWLLARGRRIAGAWLQRVAERRTETLKRRGIDVVPLVLAVVRGSLVAMFVALLVGLLDVWVGYVLGRFPITRPWAHAVSGWTLGLLADVGMGILHGIPGLVAAAVIFLLARLVSGFIRGLADRVKSGWVTLPGLHPETIGATRRIATALVWLVAIAAAYPYLPGSGSEAFKGLSLVVGLMVSLGATGVMAQAMSGLVVVYSRSLARDDYVRFGEVEGVVSEVGLLSTKVMTMRGEEVTVPNNVVVSSPVWNFTRHSGGKGPILSTTVTIGYDAPWRQVHALLLQAAGRTEGLRRDVEPFVLQRSLSDFYVQYELVVRIEKPIDRPQVLSHLHANIQDAFNAAGVQIMSPHFYAQPDQPVVVPKDRWHVPPAEPDPGPDR